MHLRQRPKCASALCGRVERSERGRGRLQGHQRVDRNVCHGGVAARRQRHDGLRSVARVQAHQPGQRCQLHGWIRVTQTGYEQRRCNVGQLRGVVDKGAQGEGFDRRIGGRGDEGGVRAPARELLVREHSGNSGVCRLLLVQHTCAQTRDKRWLDATPQDLALRLQSMFGVRRGKEREQRRVRRGRDLRRFGGCHARSAHAHNKPHRVPFVGVTATGQTGHVHVGLTVHRHVGRMRYGEERVLLHIVAATMWRQGVQKDLIEQPVGGVQIVVEAVWEPRVVYPQRASP